MDIYMTGFAGLSESLRLAADCRESLLRTLPASFLEEMAGLADLRGGAKPDSCLCSVPAEDGGVFAALWHLAEEAQKCLGRSAAGLTVFLEDIPVRQETIEVCEVLELNPYQIPSGGWLYIPGGPDLPEDLPGVRIGCMSESRARRIIGREGVRYLDKPRRQENSDLPGRQDGN